MTFKQITLEREDGTTNWSPGSTLNHAERNAELLRREAQALASEFLRAAFVFDRRTHVAGIPYEVRHRCQSIAKAMKSAMAQRDACQ